MDIADRPGLAGTRSATDRPGDPSRGVPPRGLPPQPGPGAPNPGATHPDGRPGLSSGSALGSPWEGFGPGLRLASVLTGALLFTLLVVAGVSTGRQHAPTDGVWPNAGAAILFLLIVTGRRGRLLAVLAMVVLSVVPVLLLDPDPQLVVRGVVSGVVSGVLGTWLLERWRLTPDTAEGELLARGPFLRTFGALALASGAGALAAGVVAALGPNGVGADDVAVWFGRQLTAAAFVVFPAVLVGDLRRQGRTWRTEFGAVQRRDLATVVGLSLLSVAVWVGALVQDSLAFLIIPIGIWIAARFSPFVASTWMIGFGGLVIVLTSQEFTAFGHIETLQARMLLLQLFLLTLLGSTTATVAVVEERRKLVDLLVERDRERSARLELLDSITDSIAEALVVFDGQGNLVTANATARAWARLTGEGLAPTSAGYRLLRTDGTPLPEEDYPSRRALREGVVPPHDLLIHTDAGGIVVQVQAVRLREGSALGTDLGAGAQALVVLNDVTEVRARAAKLAGFARTVREDLAGPITTAQDWVALARTHLEPATDGEPVDPARSARAVEHVGRALVRMSDLVDELLVRTRVEAGPVKPERVELEGFLGLVRQVADGAVPRARVRVGPVPAVSADREMLAEMLAAVLRSAVDRVPDGTTPEVSVTGSLQGARVVLSIADNGVGLPPAWRERVFTRFGRFPVSDEPADRSGTSLGLALARSIVERHGGTIRCEPVVPAGDEAEGSGARFVLDLPAAGPLDVEPRSVER
ncbi:sensor histidine kinase [Nocardioides bruguierae]|uniref:sensor histidine kinase n=1 Tax=Nocardioides bruguierae TaxID=2945102 RepID=UPI002020E69F|nr:HAMP domain-containing sensor histidine kinase [Nocardioides bruguierae]MCL8025377.1 PAS domain-containing sensor histidine kinase [Nocardioides bruguierae]